MANRFQIAIENSGLNKTEKISLGTSDEETSTNLVLKLWDLPEEYRKRVKQIINLFYYSGVQNALTIIKDKKFSVDELLEECKTQLDKNTLK